MSELITQYESLFGKFSSCVKVHPECIFSEHGSPVDVALLFRLQLKDLLENVGDKDYDDNTEQIIWILQRFQQIFLQPFDPVGIHRSIVVQLSKYYLTQNNYYEVSGVDHSARIGMIMTCGKSDQQLGYATESQSALQMFPRKVDVKSPRVSFIDVSSARYHSLAISTLGEVYVWGRGQGGRLGTNDQLVYLLPHKLNFDFGCKVRFVCAARDHSLVLTENGEVFAWGSNKFGQLGLSNEIMTLTPRRIQFDMGVKTKAKLLKIEIEHLSTCSSHSLAVSSSGKVFAWGKNDKGQLGFRSIAKNDATRSTPELVCHVSEEYARFCSCSDDVSLILTRPGCVFQWGNGDPTPSKVIFRRYWGKSRRIRKLSQDSMTSSQSSQGDLEENDAWGTHAVEEQTVIIINIAAGPFHCAAVSDRGEIFTWGTSADLLGYVVVGDERTRKSHSRVGHRIDSLWHKNVKIITVSCSKRHTCAIDRTNNLWVWGHGDQGVLGLPACTYQPIPAMVPTVARIIAVSPAECHTSLIMTSSSISTAICRAEISADLTKSNAFNKPPAEGESDTSSLPSDNVDGTDFLVSAIVPDTSLSSNQMLKARGSLLDMSLANIMGDVTVWNVGQLLSSARFYYFLQLETWCEAFIKANIDIMSLQKLNPFDLLSKGRKVRLVTEHSRLNEDLLSDGPTLLLAEKETSSASVISSIMQTKSDGIVTPKEKHDYGLTEIKAPVSYLDVPNKYMGKNVRPVKTGLECKVCGIWAPDDNAMADHVGGKKHRRQLEILNTHSPVTSAPSFRVNASVLENLPDSNLPSSIKSAVESPEWQEMKPKTFTRKNGTARKIVAFPGLDSSISSPVLTPLKPAGLFAFDKQRSGTQLNQEPENGLTSVPSSFSSIQQPGSFSLMSLLESTQKQKQRQKGIFEAPQTSSSDAKQTSKPWKSNNAINSNAVEEVTLEEEFSQSMFGTSVASVPSIATSSGFNVNLHSIMKEQEAESSQCSRDRVVLTESKWGFTTQKSQRLSDIQQQQLVEDERRVELDLQRRLLEHFEQLKLQQDNRQSKSQITQSRSKQKSKNSRFPKEKLAKEEQQKYNPTMFGKYRLVTSKNSNSFSAKQQ